MVTAVRISKAKSCHEVALTNTTEINPMCDLFITCAHPNVRRQPDISLKTCCCILNHPVFLCNNFPQHEHTKIDRN